jgi:hypothetical protein
MNFKILMNFIECSARRSSTQQHSMNAFATLVACAAAAAAAAAAATAAATVPHADRISTWMQKQSSF